MADVTSNRNEIDNLIDRLANAIDFTSPGKDRGVGEDLAKVIALGVRDRSVVAQEAPDGSIWPDNAPAYKKRKENRPVGIGPDKTEDGTKGGDMLSEVNLSGFVEVEPQQLTITYGTDELSKRKAQWFTNGSAPGLGEGEPSGAKNQPPRPFFSLDGKIEDEIDKYLDSYLDEYLASL